MVQYLPVVEVVSTLLKNQRSSYMLSIAANFMLLTTSPSQKPFEGASERESFQEISMSCSLYKFRHIMYGTYFYSEQYYTVHGLDYSGFGLDQETARRDWLRVFHTRFQELYAKRPFEMNLAEKKEWQAISEVVDVSNYEANTPVTYRIIAQVQEKLPKIMIRRIDGVLFTVEHEKCAPMLLGLPLGQWFEAFVKHQADPSKILEILTVLPVTSPEECDHKAFEAFLRKMKSTSQLRDLGKLI